MWLPTDERRLLAAYYCCIRSVGVDRGYKLDQLCRLLSLRSNAASLVEYSETPNVEPMASDIAAIKSEVRQYVDLSTRVDVASTMLANRGLIRYRQRDDEFGSVRYIALTLNGYDLGRRMNNWFDRSGVWFDAYRNHWVWLVVACLGASVLANIMREAIALLFHRNSPTP